MQTGLAPIYNEDTEVLILGSAPSVQSLKKQQYYGNKGNLFWQIIFTALQVADPKSYEKRLQLLLDHHIGLWDVFQNFERTGSMDHRFTKYQFNDFHTMLENSAIKTIIANGKTAYHEIMAQQLFPKQTVYHCLSTSGANNSRMQQRQNEWEQVLNKIITTYFGKEDWIKAAAFYLRYQVFVLEQQIAPYLEFDEQTKTSSNYFVSFKQKEPIATIRYDTYDKQTICPDRFCVSKKLRKQGVGANLLKTLEQKARNQGYKYSLLTAEEHAILFYQKNGYYIDSKSFLEDGISCVKMKKIL